MSLREIGFGAGDFEKLTLPELYLRFCIAHRRQKELAKKMERK